MSSNFSLPTYENLGEYLFQINILSETNNTSFIIFLIIPKLDHTLTSNCVELAFSENFNVTKSPEIQNLNFKMSGTNSSVKEDDLTWIKLKDSIPVEQYRFVNFITDMTQKHVLPFLDKFSVSCGGKEFFPDNKSCIDFLQSEMLKIFNSFEQKKYYRPIFKKSIYYLFLNLLSIMKKFSVTLISIKNLV